MSWKLIMLSASRERIKVSVGCAVCRTKVPDKIGRGDVEYLICIGAFEVGVGYDQRA